MLMYASSFFYNNRSIFYIKYCAFNPQNPLLGFRKYLKPKDDLIASVHAFCQKRNISLSENEPARVEEINEDETPPTQTKPK